MLGSELGHRLIADQGFQGDLGLESGGKATSFSHVSIPSVEGWDPIGSTRIVFAICEPSGRTKCGARTWPTSRCDVASFTWWRSWTGRRARCFRGGCRTTLDGAFCREALQEALAGYGRPEIFNTDQGSQFSSREFTELLERAGVEISMDGKGRWRDNVFIERLWRSPQK